MTSTRLAEDLSCPVCCDIFRDPVILSCSHSVCRGCVEKFWRVKSRRECPLCRTKSSEPLRNLVLKNLCESLSKESSKSISESKQLCHLHEERFKLFCVYDKKLACVVCQTSREHKNHKFFPVEEAAHDKRLELKTALRVLEEKLRIFKQAKETCDQEIQHIRAQAERTEQKIKKVFRSLQEFLTNEEASRIAALRKEARKKNLMMHNRSLDLNSGIRSLTNDISVLSKEMCVEDISFLQNIKSTMKRAQCSLVDPQMYSGAGIKVSKHLQNLKSQVLEKMEDFFLFSKQTRYFLICASDKTIT